MSRATQSEPGYGTYKPQAASDIAKLIERLVSGSNIFDQPGWGGTTSQDPDVQHIMDQGITTWDDINKALLDPNNLPTPAAAPNDLQLLAQQRAATGSGVAAPQADPLAQLLQVGQRLMGGSGGSGFDYESAKNDVLGQINNAYAPMIAAIRGQSKHARKETNRNQDELQHLYGALARFDNKQARREGKRTNRESLAIQRLGNRTGNQIQNVTDRTVGAEKSLLKGLGIQAAAGQSITPMLKENQFQQNANTQSSASAQKLTRGLGGNQQDFLGSLAGAAKLEGTNAQADALSQLQSYLGQNRLAIAGVLGQQAQARAAALQQLASASATAAGSNDQFANWNTLFDNILAARGQNFDEQQAQQDAQGAATPESYLPQNYQDAQGVLQGRPALLDVLQQLLSSPDIVAGKQLHNSQGGNDPITPEYAMQLIAQLAADNKIQDPNNLSLLRQAALTYFS